MNSAKGSAREASTKTLATKKNNANGSARVASTKEPEK
jgi:hypothetical protein